MFGVGVSIVVAVGEESALRPDEARNRKAAGWWNISAKVSECPLSRLTAFFRLCLHNALRDEMNTIQISTFRRTPVVKSKSFLLSGSKGHSICSGKKTPAGRILWQRNRKSWTLKPVAHRRKQLSKLPGKAVCSAVSSRVRRSFRENFATQGREENICHVWYFWPRKADSSPCAVNV